MSYRIKVTLILFLISAVQLLAIPARKGIYTYTQPNGISFQVKIDGDEFYKRVTTVDGCAITQEKDGYYCYAYYDQQGLKHSSGVKVGPATGASQAAAAARNIPNEILRRRAAEMRERISLSRQRRSKAMAAPVTKGDTRTQKALIILAQFPDLKFTYTRTNFVNMLTAPNYTFNGATGSALKYFNDQFEGKYNFEFVVSPIVTLSKGYAYYGANGDNDQIDVNAAEGVAEACRLLDSSINFADFDLDGDGEVDNIFVFVPGQDEAEGAGEDHIWSHQWHIEAAGVHCTLDGKKIGVYAISTEISHDMTTWDTMFTTIGSFCHEFSHCLGLNDLYDTDYEESGGISQGVWKTTSLMDSGCYNNSGHTPPCYNALELETFGLGECLPLELGDYSLQPLSSKKRYIRAETDVDGEYFLFECRNASGWDKYIGGAGLLIYHIDKSDNSTGYSDYWERAVKAYERWENNEVNNNPDHQCAYIVPALPTADDVSQVFWPNGQHNTFNPDTQPSFTYWSGGIPTISVTDIHKSGDGVELIAVGPLAIEKVEEFQDAAIVLWTATGGVESSKISITGPDGRAKEYTVKPYSDGCFAYTFEGLQPKTTYTVSVSTSESGSKKVSAEFTTKGYYSDGYPFIYLNSAERNNDGSFQEGSKIPLRIFNAKGVAKVEWNFSARSLEGDGSGYYTIKSGGIIKAYVHYEDGSSDVISKTIKVK